MNITQEIETLNRWRTHPLEWVKYIFGDNIKEKSKMLSRGRCKTETGLSTQQEKALVELGRLIQAKLKLAKGEELTAREIEYVKKVGVSIQSGTGTGKDTLASIVMFFFLYCFPNPKITCTANSSKQLRNVLWSEVSKVMSMSKKIDPTDPKSETILEHLFEWQSEKVFMKAKEGRRWFAEAVTISTNASEDAQAETLAGRHEDYLLFIIDEASGIPEPVFRPIEGTLTGTVNIVLMVFNPTRSRGFAVRSHRDDSDRWIPLRWNSEESELVSPESCKILADKYGMDSNTYRIRVLGLPPLADSDALIPWDWLEDAKEREIEPLETDYLVKGWDFGAGGDKSVIATKRGGRVYPFKRNSTKDSNRLTDWVHDDFVASGAKIGYGDIIGIGWAIMGNLRKLLGTHKVRPVDSRNRANNPERFYNKRAENYWTLREAFENKEIQIPNDENLINQLGATKYTEETGKIKIKPKEFVKKELEGDSPDEADAVANMYSNARAIHRKADDYDEDEEEQYESVGWMGA